MTEELGRELTSAEAIAVATGRTTIMDIVHAYALELDAKRDAEIHAVMPSGTVITRGELWREMNRSRIASRQLRPHGGHSWIVGVNASSNMFA